MLLFEHFNIYNHLKERGIDPEKTRVVIDNESGNSFFYLYNFSGQLIGYQKYNALYPKTSKDPLMAKYFTWITDEGYGNKIAVWGLETIDTKNDEYFFITEGIFDIARVHEVGYPGIAVLCNDPNSQLKYWLSTLPQKKIVIYDNDTPGKKLIKVGDYAFTVPSGKDLNDLNKDDAKLFIEYCLSKINI